MAAPDAPVPPVGSKIEAHSLVTQAHINGQRGQVLRHQPLGAGVAVVVQFPTAGTMALKPQNCKQVYDVGDVVEAHGLVSMVAVNGAQGTVTAESTPGVFTVDFKAPHGLLAIKAANLRPVPPPDDQSPPQSPTAGSPPASPTAASPPGEADPSAYPVGGEVEAHSLVSMVALNGQRGRILSHRQGTGGVLQIVVRFSDPHGALALKTNNLRLISGPDAPAAPAGSPPAAAAPPPAAVPPPAAPPPAAPDAGAAAAAATPPAQPAQAPPASPPAAPGTPSSAPAAAGPALAVGDLVEAHSLLNLVALNGVRGQVRALRAAPDGSQQVVVNFPPPHGAMALRPANLRLAALGGPGAVQSAVGELRAPRVPGITMEGFLDKKKGGGGAVGGGSDTRWFSLRGSTLVYYEEKGRIKVSAATQAMMGPGSTFTLQGPGMSRKFELKAESPNKAEAWVQSIREHSTHAARNALPQLEVLQGLELGARAYIEMDYWVDCPTPPGGAPRAKPAAEGEEDPQAALKARVAELEQQLAAAKAAPPAPAPSATTPQPDPQQQQELQRAREAQLAAEAKSRELELRVQALQAAAAAAPPASAAPGATVDQQRLQELERQAVLRDAELLTQRAARESAESQLAAARGQVAALEAQFKSHGSTQAGADVRIQALEQQLADARAVAASGGDGSRLLQQRVDELQRDAAGLRARADAAESRAAAAEARAATAEARGVAGGGAGAASEIRALAAEQRCRELQDKVASLEQRRTQAASPDPRVAALQRRVDELQRLVAQGAGAGQAALPYAMGGSPKAGAAWAPVSPGRKAQPAAANFIMAD